MRRFRIELVREARASDVPGEILSDSVGVARVLAPEFDGLDREKFIVLLLDAKHRVIGVNTVSIGSLTASIVHPREVFKPAIAGNSAAVILAHNHPSGDPAPSLEDVELTKFSTT